MSDLNEILPEMEEGTKTLVVRGQIGFSPVVQNTPKDRYRILRRLLGPTFGKDVPWMRRVQRDLPAVHGTTFRGKTGAG